MTLLERSQRSSDILFSQIGQAFGCHEGLEGCTILAGLGVALQRRDLVDQIAGGDARLVGGPTFGTTTVEDPPVLLQPQEQPGRRNLKLFGGIANADRAAGRCQALDGSDLRRLIQNNQSKRLVFLGLVGGR